MADKYFKQVSRNGELYKVKDEEARLVQVTATLMADAWEADTDEDGNETYTQTITVEGMTADKNGSIGITQDISYSAYMAAASAGLYICGQGTGTVTIKATGDVPEVDIPCLVSMAGGE